MEEDHRKYMLFKSRAGFVGGAHWFWENGLTLTDTCDLIAGEEDVETIRQFCELNPSFHMVTLDDDDMVHNKYIPGNFCYFLAEGDANPELESVKFCLFPSDAAIKEAGEIIEKMIEKLQKMENVPTHDEIFPPRIYN
jgi:hypothetical protein